MPKLDTWTEQQPVGSRLAEWHSHATGINDPHASDQSVELHVRVAANDQRRASGLKDRKKVFLRCRQSEDLGVAPRRGISEEDLAHAVDLETKR